MPYDDIGSPSQLGSDLQIYSSNGNSFLKKGSGINDIFYWDATAGWGGGGQFSGLGAESMIDMCVHEGDLHVVWVEPEYNSGIRRGRGPFVKKWNGSSWVSVGGEVEPDLTPTDITQWFGMETASIQPPDIYPGDYNSIQSAPSVGSIGTIFYPARPRIVSDGTDLYIAYTVRVVDTAPNHPPIGSGIVLTPDSSVSLGEYTLWTARWAFIRKWTGSDWDLYGQIAPIANNTHYKSGNSSPDPKGLYSTRLDVEASSAEPGVVYMAISEAGLTNTVAVWDVSGTWTYSGGKYRFVAGRFDGGDVNGDLHELALFTYADHNGSSLLPDFRQETMPVYHSVTGNRSGEGFIFWVNEWNPTISEETVMMKLSDESVVQSGIPNERTFGSKPQSIGHFDGNYYVYFDEDMKVRQIKDDGTEAYDYVDSNSSLGTIPFNVPNNDYGAYIYFGNLHVLPEAGNIWIASDHLFYYHSDCAAWVDYGQIAQPDDDTKHLYGRPAAAIIGDDIYQAICCRDTTDGSDDLRFQVWKIPIDREAHLCPGESPPSGPIDFSNVSFRSFEGDTEDPMFMSLSLPRSSGTVEFRAFQ